MSTRSRHSVKDRSTPVAKGVAIYRTHASPFWMARVRDSRAGKYVVRSTQEISKLEARRVAQELARQILSGEPETPREFTFKHYATKLIDKGRKQAQRGERDQNYIRTIRLALDNNDWGLMGRFASHDVRELRTRDYDDFILSTRTGRPDLSSSTLNIIRTAFRNVLKVARDDGVITLIPDTPRVSQQDNPRPYFHFSNERNEYQMLLKGAKQLARDGPRIRGVPVAEEFYELILFCVHSFVRPPITELYALKHNDIALESNPKRLLVTIRNGKTGHRVANTMEGAVAAYERLCKRYPDASGEDHIFLPHYRNRATAARIFQRQFNELLEQTGLKHDATTNTDRSTYCLRHTAICMRIVLSQDQVNIYTLAKNAGTSVEQIERFYAKHLPISREMTRNLRSFGEQRVART